LTHALLKKILTDVKIIDESDTHIPKDRDSEDRKLKIYKLHNYKFH